MIVKHSVTVNNRRTSISLEDTFWTALRMIATKRKTKMSKLISSIELEHGRSNLSSACRLFVLARAMDRTL